MAWNNKAKFNQSGCPCVADCEKRCVGCRSTCEPFKEYDAKRIERDKSFRYRPYGADDYSPFCKPLTASSARITRVNDRIRRQKARGYLV